MLVLTRRKDEAIQIGDAISVKVVEISGGKVRLAVTAPVEMPISRSHIGAKPPDRMPGDALRSPEQG